MDGSERLVHGIGGMFCATNMVGLDIAICNVVCEVMAFDVYVVPESYFQCEKKEVRECRGFSKEVCNESAHAEIFLQCM